MKAEQLAGMARHRSVKFALAFGYFESVGWNNANIESICTRIGTTEKEKDDLFKLWHKKIIMPKHAPTRFERRQKELQAGMSFIRMVAKRKKMSKLRKEASILHLWQNFRSRHIDSEHLDQIINPTKDSIKMIGQYAADHEDALISYRMPVKEEKPYYKELPLYACSGELEADSMNSTKIYNLAKGLHREHETRSHSVTRYWKYSDKLEFKRDGGGQAETTFLIRPELARIVCKSVARIGRLNRNGGHIHINCQKDEQIGRRVFAALRFHLCWMRWLAGSVRRNHQWSQMSGVADTFDEATQKACAITRYTWNRTGTIEMRLWGTSHKPEDWLGRAALMQAIAKWSEDYSPALQPIDQNAETTAWPLFFTWASTNAPEALRYTLTQFRKRSRSTVLNPADKESAIRLMSVFEQSGVTVAGYRRRRLVNQLN